MSASPSEEVVSVERYQALRDKFEAAERTSNDATLALFRAQKVLVKLREEKASLLDRVLLLESAAQLAPSALIRAQLALPSTSNEALLVNPPALPSLADRARPRPELNTQTDLSSSSYNDPIGPPPLPSNLPPRLRSHHMISALAAQKLSEDASSRRVAEGLPAPRFAVVAILGLEGSNVAGNVERALAGESFDSTRSWAPGSAEEEGRTGERKRRRESAGAEKSNKPRKAHPSPPPPPPVVQSHTALPNPFAMPNPFVGAGATPQPPAPAPVEPPTVEPAPIAQPPPAPVAAPAPAPPLAALALPPLPPVPAQAVVPMQLDADDASQRGSLGPESIASDEKPTTTKSKKPKATPVAAGVHSIPHIPRHPNGTPVLPIQVGIMFLHSLGTVDPRDAFHTERYLFTPGFEAVRKYPSMVHKDATVDYLCTIVDGGDNAPKFEIHPSDQPGVVFSAATPTGAWSQVVKGANLVRERNHSNSVSGPDYFGISHIITRALVQELPGAKDVPGYITQTFVEEAEAASAKSTKKAGASRRKVKQETEEPLGQADDDNESVANGSQVGYNGYGSPARGSSLGPGSPTGSLRSSKHLSPVPANPYEIQAAPSTLSHLVHAAPPTAPPHNPYSIPAARSPYAIPSAVATPAFDPYALPVAPGASPTTAAIDPAFGGYDPSLGGGRQ